MAPAFLALLLAAGDVTALTAAEALDRAVREAPSVRVAAARVQEALSVARGAGTLPDPELWVIGENFLATREITGKTGLEGLEGQVTLQQTLPLGGDLAAARRAADALATAARAEVAAQRATVRRRAVEIIAAAERDAVLAGAAEAEAEALSRLAAATTARAEEGRTSGADAARTRLEAIAAATDAARAAARARASAAELLRLLNLPSGSTVAVRPPPCRAEESRAATPPALVAASARLDAAAAQQDAATAQRFPDITPQIGVRRTAAATGLYLGLGLELPVWGRRSAAVDAAASAREAARADRAAVELELLLARTSARDSLAELEAAGARFDGSFRRDLDRVVQAADARHAAGEGTLLELLDARRARLLAITAHESWRAERRRLRAELDRAEGRDVSAAALCEEEP